MNPVLQRDSEQLAALLDLTVHEALYFLDQIDALPPNAVQPTALPCALPDTGLGAENALRQFQERFAAQMTASTGPRYWGFVTGGTTPAALMGDWLASAYDINLADRGGSSAPTIELEAIAMLRQLFGLPDTFSGVFVSGATQSNLVGLALGREWVSRRMSGDAGRSAAQHGLAGLPPIAVLSAEPHSSAIKAAAILGLGRDAIQRIAQLPGNREAMDTADLRRALIALNGKPCIVLASAGTVNTVDFDDLHAIAALRNEFPFWLHVDGAFGGFAACSPRFQDQVAGIELADSVTVDAHKWLNVPYDSAMIFTRHPTLQGEVFQNSAAYLPDLSDTPDFFHLTPENSRRFRALPAWFTLTAYGKDGYREIVERCCDLAQEIGRRIDQSDTFRLLAPVRMNVVCFTFRNSRDKAAIQRFLAALRDDGKLFLTPSYYGGEPGVRAALVNWRTTPDDLDIAWEAMMRCAG